MLSAKTGAHGQSCTDTGDVLNVVPLLVGLHERTPPAGLFHRLMSWLGDRLSCFALGDAKWSACRVTLPGEALI